MHGGTDGSAQRSHCTDMTEHSVRTLYRHSDRYGHGRGRSRSHQSYMLKFLDGSMIAIDTIAVENEISDNMYQRSELDYLIYNDPVGYADLILNGDPETYLKTVTEYRSLDS